MDERTEIDLRARFYELSLAKNCKMKRIGDLIEYLKEKYEITPKETVGGF